MQSSEKRNVIILSILFLILAGIAIYFLLRQRSPSVPFYTRNPATGEFEKTNTLPADPTILDLDLGAPNQADNFSLTRVLKGYFHHYNESQEMLEIKSDVLWSVVLGVAVGYKLTKHHFAGGQSSRWWGRGGGGVSALEINSRLPTCTSSRHKLRVPPKKRDGYRRIIEVHLRHP